MVSQTAPCQPAGPCEEVGTQGRDAVAEVRIKKIKTRWGTCNSEATRIWLNLELVKKPVPCLEFLVVHEMVHSLERRHNRQFLELMDRLMPLWRIHRDQLNRAPLAHAEWTY